MKNVNITVVLMAEVNDDIDIDRLHVGFVRAEILNFNKDGYSEGPVGALVDYETIDVEEVEVHE